MVVGGGAIVIIAVERWVYCFLLFCGRIDVGVSPVLEAEVIVDVLLDKSWRGSGILFT